MSDTQGTLVRVPFHHTPAHPCSYLPDQQARTLFADPRLKMTVGLYSTLSEMGFRRSGSHVYRPQCQACQACVPVRLEVARFQPTRQQRRTLAANQHTHTRWVQELDTDEYYELYERYINGRHADGDMYPPTREQYRAFLGCSWGDVRAIEVRANQELIAVGVMDVLVDGLSAVYSFFAPELQRRSLGTLLVLREIDLAQKAGLRFLYLGYWIAASTKMNYKINFQPHQRYIDNQWVSAPPSA